MTIIPRQGGHSRALARYSYLEYLDVREPGTYHDGGGLYLRIGAAGTKSWLFRYMINGQARWMGLGTFRLVNLKKARKKARAAAELLEDGIDPLAVKVSKETADLVTFEQYTDAYIKSREKGWKGTDKKHNKYVWEHTMEAFAYPAFGSMRPMDITLPHVQTAIDPLWEDRTQTAKRLLKRIETVLDYARAKDAHRDAPGRWRENPARWKGLWDKLKESPRKTAPTQSHRAIGFAEIGKFMHELSDYDYITVRPLELLILTASRADMVAAAEWREFDLDKKVWSLPAERMKNKKPFSIPLSDRAIEIIREMNGVRENKFVFPGYGKDGHLSRSTLNKLLIKMHWADRTVVHGFRSTFRTWAANETAHTFDVCEMALAHSQGDETYAAYQRGDLLKKRRVLMNDWSDFVVASKLAA